MKRIAIFASGAGSNAKKIIEHFGASETIEVALIVCNKPNAGVCGIAREKNIPLLLIDKEQFQNGNGYSPELLKEKIDWIVLAGFLWKIPVSLINAFPNKIINIHPALLPKFGGKGMYGNNVHQAVIDAKENESGITIHFVDEQYDHGQTIFQATCSVLPGDTATDLAHKIHALEHEHFPIVIENVIGKTK